MPGGSFESKPTWWSAVRAHRHVGFFRFGGERCREREGLIGMERTTSDLVQQILARAGRPETPLHEKCGLLENISRMQHGLTPDELRVARK